MEHEQYESPQSDAFDPSQMDDLSLKGCPYLGLVDDPQTTLAFPNRANLCHRLQAPVGVDLSHQGGYCLSSNYASCYVYGEPEDAAEALSKTTKLGLSFMALKSLRSSLFEKRPSLNVDLQPLKARFASVSLFNRSDLDSLKARIPSVSSLNKFDSESLKSTFQSIDRSKFQLDKSAIASTISRWDLSPATAKSRLLSLDNRQLSLIILPLALLIIFLAAAIWWPQGETDQDALALGNSVGVETAVDPDQNPTGSLPQMQNQPPEAVTANALESESNSTENETSAAAAVDQPPEFSSESQDKIPAGRLVEDQQPDSATTTASAGAATAGESTQIAAGQGAAEQEAIADESTETVADDALQNDEDVSAPEQDAQQDPETQVAPQETITGSSENIPPGASNSTKTPDGEIVLATGLINAGALNIRTGPGLDHESLGYVFNKQEVLLLELPTDDNAWVKVRSADGLVGWLNSKYLVEVAKISPSS